MNTQEKLQAIRARCVELLAIAEKRTPGEWEAEGNTVWRHDTERESSSICDTVSHAHWSDAAFIASCAGPAEAGWRATIAAIDGTKEVRHHYPAEHNPMLSSIINEQEEAIITAWEGLV